MNKDERALIDEQFKNVNLIMGNGFEKMESSLNRIMEYNEYQNGRIASAITKISGNRDDINNIKNNPAIKPMLKKPYLFIVGGICVIFIVIFAIATKEQLGILFKLF